jgi:hypothetical protein
MLCCQACFGWLELCSTLMAIRAATVSVDISVCCCFPAWTIPALLLHVCCGLFVALVVRAVLRRNSCIRLCTASWLVFDILY